MSTRYFCDMCNAEVISLSKTSDVNFESTSIAPNSEIYNRFKDDMINTLHLDVCINCKLKLVEYIRNFPKL